MFRSGWLEVQYHSEYLIWEFSLEFSKTDTPRIKNNERV
jgi:hypothetical protein